MVNQCPQCYFLAIKLYNCGFLEKEFLLFCMVCSSFSIAILHLIWGKKPQQNSSCPAVSAPFIVLLCQTISSYPHISFFFFPLWNGNIPMPWNFLVFTISWLPWNFTLHLQPVWWRKCFWGETSLHFCSAGNIKSKGRWWTKTEGMEINGQ